MDASSIAARCFDAVLRVAVASQCFGRPTERWHPTKRNHTVEDVRQWFDALDPAHPAHQERVPFNHPRGILSPHYFDDVSDEDLVAMG
jgi:hypothetical protein